MKTIVIAVAVALMASSSMAAHGVGRLIHHPHHHPHSAKVYLCFVDSLFGHKC